MQLAALILVQAHCEQAARFNEVADFPFCFSENDLFLLGLSLPWLARAFVEYSIAVQNVDAPGCQGHLCAATAFECIHGTAGISFLGDSLKRTPARVCCCSTNGVVIRLFPVPADFFLKCDYMSGRPQFKVADD